MSKLFDSNYLLEKLKELQFSIRDEIRKQMLQAKEQKRTEYFSQVHGFGNGDVTYKIDVPAEEVLEKYCQKISEEIPLVVISEATGLRTYPSGISPDEAEIRVIVDPIDGTREIMYDRRSAHILTGVAPNKGDETNLSDIEIAMQTEIPTTKQYLADTLYAIKGRGAIRETWNVLTNTLEGTYKPTPSTADTIENGFVSFFKPFPGAKELTSALEEELYREILGPVQKGKAKIFDDQYITNGGQLHLLETGGYRMVADIRPYTDAFLQKQNQELGLCAHPYDLSTTLIAKEAGCIVKKVDGGEIDYPLETKLNVGLVAYANKKIENQVEPVFQKLLKKYELL